MYRAVFAACIISFAAACSTTAPPSESVRPGINKKYLDPELDPSKWVERFEREGREVFDKREEIARAVNIQPGEAVADVGAGTGLFVPLLSKAVGADGKVIAVDIVPKFLQTIKAKADEQKLENIETLLCSERSTKLQAASVHKVFICDTYHHFEYPADTMASILNALRPGGEVFLVDFKRIPGESSDWMLKHVRAGQETVVDEIKAVGFELVEEVDLGLKENYALRFKKPE